jgi:4-aminobutyrate aminotransferase/(S)-3-amino-2-methylpropionate transaminase
MSVAPVVGGPKHLRVITELPGPRSREVRRVEAEHLAPGAQAIASYAGIAVQSGRGCDLFDVDGNRFLDLSAAICVASIGYGNPRYVRALTAQLSDVHAGSFTTPVRVQALTAVASMLPAGLDKIQLFSGGAEAVESAIRLARAHTGKHEVLSFWGGFHGKTSGALAQMGSEFKHGLGPLAPGAYLTPYADCARCPFKLQHPTCGLLCVDFARDKLKKETTGRLAAVLVEPIQGTAGNIVPPIDWLPAIAEVAREAGALLIADEMITGFGRTGRNFGVERSAVQPDIMTLGKALGGGYPVSAVATRSAIAVAEPWSKPSFSSSSYGGSPLASAAIAASVSVIRDERLVARAGETGRSFITGLRSLADRRPEVTNVRGEGLMIGFDLSDPRTAEPWSAPACLRLFNALLRRGVLSMAYAPRVRINPPLVITHDEVDEALGALEEALQEVA